MKTLLRKIKNHFGFDAPGDIYFRHLIYPRRIWNICKYLLYKNRRPIRVPYYPIVLMVEVSTKCNLECPGCERELYKLDGRMQQVPMENVKPEAFEKLAGVLPYIYSTYFVGGLGEPFMNKRFWEIHRFFKRFKIMTGYISNGMLIDEQAITKTFDEDVNRVLISIDSHIREKYESVKRKANFDQVLDVVNRFVEQKKKRKAKRFQIGLNYILMSDNYRDMLDYIDFAHRLGVDFILFSSFITHIESQKYRSFFNVDNYEKEILFAQARKKAASLGISIRLPRIAPQKELLCNCLWHGVCVFYNGDVCACPFFRTPRKFYHRVDDDYNVICQEHDCNDTILGNYQTDEFFNDIWNGPKARAIRQSEKNKDRAFNPCGTCYYKYELH